MATAPAGICHCAHPRCKACQGQCRAPGTNPVSIQHEGKNRGEFRFCGPCADAWTGMDDMDVKPMLSPLQGEVHGQSKVLTV